MKPGFDFQQPLGPGRPLCCRYLLVQFAPVPVALGAGTAVPAGCLVWALGTLGNAQREVLGTWPHAADGPQAWADRFDELARRGVESIRFVRGADEQAARGRFPQSRALPAASPGPDLLPPRVRGRLQRAQATAQQLQRGLLKAVLRQGPFASPQAAATFAEAWLTHGLRRMQHAAQPGRLSPPIPAMPAVPALHALYRAA